MHLSGPHKSSIISANVFLPRTAALGCTHPVAVLSALWGNWGPPHSWRFLLFLFPLSLSPILSKLIDMSTAEGCSNHPNLLPPHPAQESCTRAPGRTSSWRSSPPSSPASCATAAAGASPVPAATALLKATSCSPQSPWPLESTGASSLVTSITSDASFPLETWPASWSYGKWQHRKPAFTLWLPLLQNFPG